MVTQLAVAPVTAHSDCALVLRTFQGNLQEQLKHNKKHAAFRKLELGHAISRGEAATVSLSKVKAHEDPAKIEDPELRRRAMHNNLVDSDAKAAARELHRFIAPDTANQASAAAKVTLRYAQAVAKLLAAWPSEKRPGKLTRASVADRACRTEISVDVSACGNEATVCHEWVFSDAGFWRCRRCMHFTHNRRTYAQLTRRPCPGTRSAILDAVRSRRRLGHHLQLAYARAGVITWCDRCFAWAHHRPQGLLTSCRGNSAAAANKNLANLRHPQDKEDALCYPVAVDLLEQDLLANAAGPLSQQAPPDAGLLLSAFHDKVAAHFAAAKPNQQQGSSYFHASTSLASPPPISQAAAPARQPTNSTSSSSNAAPAQLQAAQVADTPLIKDSVADDNLAHAQFWQNLSDSAPEVCIPVEEGSVSRFLRSIFE